MEMKEKNFKAARAALLEIPGSEQLKSHTKLQGFRGAVKAGSKSTEIKVKTSGPHGRGS